MSYDETDIVSMGVLKKVPESSFWDKKADRKFCKTKSNKFLDEIECEEISESDIKTYYHGEDIVHTRPKFFKRKVRNLPDLDKLKSMGKLRYQ